MCFFRNDMYSCEDSYRRTYQRESCASVPVRCRTLKSNCLGIIICLFLHSPQNIMSNNKTLSPLLNKERRDKVCELMHAEHLQRSNKVHKGNNYAIIPSPFFPSREAEPHISMRERVKETFSKHKEFKFYVKKLTKVILLYIRFFLQPLYNVYTVNLLSGTGSVCLQKMLRSTHPLTSPQCAAPS